MYTKDQEITVTVMKDGAPTTVTAKCLFSADNPWVWPVDGQGDPDVANYPKPLSPDKYKVVA
jgi:hypothetical protein